MGNWAFSNNWVNFYTSTSLGEFQRFFSHLSSLTLSSATILTLLTRSPKFSEKQRRSDSRLQSLTIHTGKLSASYLRKLLVLSSSKSSYFSIAALQKNVQSAFLISSDHLIIASRCCSLQLPAIMTIFRSAHRKIFTCNVHFASQQWGLTASLKPSCIKYSFRGDQFTPGRRIPASLFPHL